MIGNPIAFARFGLPLIAVFVFAGEQTLHNGGDHAAVGDDNAVLRNPGPRFPRPLRHLRAAFAARFVPLVMKRTFFIA